MKLRLASLCAVSVAAAGCSDEPVNYSAPVGINLKAKSDDTQNGTVTTEKGITTESGNPYGAFVSSAERELGHAPGRIEIDRVELFLGASSTGVTALGEVFAGEAELLFQMNDTNNSFSVAKKTIVVGDNAGPLAFDATFSSDAMADADYNKLLGGSFKVVLRGPPPRASTPRAPTPIYRRRSRSPRSTDRASQLVVVSCPSRLPGSRRGSSGSRDRCRTRT